MKAIKRDEVKRKLNQDECVHEFKERNTKQAKPELDNNEVNKEKKIVAFSREP